MTETRTLLLRWHDGDAEAFAALVRQEADWIQSHVRSRLGALLRRRHTQDIVQSALIEVLRDGPRFLVSDRGHLRALLARMVENVLRGKAHHEIAGKRDVRREVAAPRAPSGETLLDLDGSARVTPPDRAAERSETREWVRLALEFLETADRHSILWRDYEALSFVEIGARLGVAEDAARMRYRRALPKLARALADLRGGRIGSLL